MIEKEQMERMQQAVAEIRRTMAEAAIRAGRKPEDILLCAACKTRTVEEVRASAFRQKPPLTEIPASSRLSAMVEQAPYSPKVGTSLFRMEKLEPMHWLSRSPASRIISALSRSASCAMP